MTDHSLPLVPTLTTSTAALPRRRWARGLLFVMAAVQLLLGVAFLVSPAGTAALLGLPPAPAWTGWLFAMMAARFLGYGVGMLAAARHPERHPLWIRTMAAIQLIDWVATLAALARHDVTLAQVTTAAFLPPLFIAALLAVSSGAGGRGIGRSR